MTATMIKEFRLPDLGEGLTESEILSWKVAVGDTVTLNQVIAEVETAKAVVELPSPFAGVVAELHEQPGTVVEVGKPIVSFEVDDAGSSNGGGAPDRGDQSVDNRPLDNRPLGNTPVGDRSAVEISADGGSSAAGTDAVGAPAKREPNLVGYGAVVERSGRPTRRARGQVQDAKSAPPAAPAVSEPTVARKAEADVSERPRSTPPVRKLARDLGIELELVPGTGPGGLITREDVQNFSTAIRSSSRGSCFCCAG
jgi:2-oxoisovalerate dehydrogenase E2 component (dihydrolipoyl transacylase)